MELLNQMDGFDQTVNVKVIMATNRADTLDPALLRPGRLDRKIEFPLPDRRQKRLVFQVSPTLPVSCIICFSSGFVFQRGSYLPNCVRACLSCFSKPSSHSHTFVVCNKSEGEGCIQTEVLLSHTAAANSIGVLLEPQSWCLLCSACCTQHVAWQHCLCLLLLPSATPRVRPRCAIDLLLDRTGIVLDLR